jgi:prepilin-type N-terminal cleavage/methylation domain-containing protein
VFFFAYKNKKSYNCLMNVAMKKKAGFTLIEIMVVITIMAVLTAIVYASFNGARTGARDNQKISDMNVIQLALEEYYNQNHTYPANSGNLSVLVPQYMPSVPVPPTGGSYNYFPLTQVSGSSICTSYHLWVTLEQNTNSYLQSKKGFDSSATGLSPNSSYYQCGSGYPGINAASSAFIYDVVPQ